jgi:uncharacterized protein
LVPRSFHLRRYACSISRRNVTVARVRRHPRLDVAFAKTLADSRHEKARPTPGVGNQASAAFEQDLLDTGEIVRVDVEGARGAQFVLASDVQLLAEVDGGRVPAAWAPVETSTEAEVTLLSPLDPVSARGRAKALFNFDYVWEIYKKPELMQFGRYAMPILWGDRLVGQIDAKMDRKSNTLVVNGVWLESILGSLEPEFLDALALGVQRAMAFLGTERVDAATVKHRKVRSRIVALNKRRPQIQRQPARNV